jgi:hypothetical protein
MSSDTPARAQRRAEIERLLAKYPHLTSEAHRDLTDWFADEASSFDVAMLACNESIAEPYRAFRAAHIDRLGPREWVRGLAVAGLFVMLLAGVLWKAF